MQSNKIIILLLLIFILNSNLLSFSKGNEKALTEIKKVLVEDRNCRIIAVLPYKNTTKNDYYEYIGKTVQKFLYNYLLNLNMIYITTNDIIVPEKYKTNKSVIINYGTNFTRDAIILSPEKINDIYYKLPYPENKKFVSEKLDTDYIIYGKYNFYKKSRDKFITKTYIYNYAQNSNFYICNTIISKDTIENDVAKISENIFKFFTSSLLGTLEIITCYSNFQIFIDSNVVGKQLIFDKIPAGPHTLTLRFENNYIIEKEFTIKPKEKTTLYFTNRKLFSEKATLKIVTYPTNAKIFLDVNFLGNSPLIITNLKIKEYRLRVEKKGYKTYFKNIKLKSGINNISINLKKEITQEMRAKKHRQNKTIMYTSLGIGCTTLLISYYFYAKSDVEWDKYLIKFEKKYYKNYKNHRILSFILGAAGLGCLTVSFIYFLKVISYDDVNIGLIKTTPYLALHNNNWGIFFYRRF